jgi:ATP-dependent helicase/nuclease subunit A
MAKKRKPAAGATDPAVPADQAQREQILHCLDRNLLVEAAAGTGKTTSMVGRMINLLAGGHCTIATLAAVTFTRKAAAELRERFQARLEQAARSETGPAAALLGQAARQIERCFIGTIHSFCGRLLRERPVEAGVDVGFQELDEAADQLLKDRAWDDYVAGLYAGDDPLLTELDELGLEIGQLKEAFCEYATYPDVTDWPAPPAPRPDFGPAHVALDAYARDMQKLAPTLPEDPGRDALMPMYRLIPRLVRQMDSDRPAELAEVLDCFRPKSVVQKNWPGGKVQALAEKARWDEFVTNYAAPAVRAWRECRYEPILRTIRPACTVYQQLRQHARGLNFQDLLLQAAELLRKWPAVRRYFRGRFTHLLVDEFQDTDPIQAEVLLLLTADDAGEKDWRKCRPMPGSLFVVGDPKQSIFRFRRADIITYRQVKDIIEKNRGLVVPLSTNFRSIGRVIDWVNQTFDQVFPDAETNYMPAKRPMATGRAGDSDGTLAGVFCLQVPPEHGNKETVIEFEADLVARTIRRAIDHGQTVPRTPKERAQGIGPAAVAEDFLIVTHGKKQLAAYGRKLQELGVPHEVTGGSALGDVPEADLLCTCLRAALHPDDALALVATLRGELFGLSDTVLYALRRAKGHFNFKAPLPKDLRAEEAAVFEAAFGRLKCYHQWLTHLPAMAAIERVVADLGLVARASAAEGGNVRAGTLGKLVELLRAAQPELLSTAELVEYLGQLVQKNAAFDSVPARPHQARPVRVMNLHKVKGLEAPVVVLVCPLGESDHPVKVHIDRTKPTVRGYLAIYGTSAGHHAPLLACPPAWEEWAKEEQQFLDAERKRLLYVAATRAGTQLVISQRASRNNTNPWQFFKDHLAAEPVLADPGQSAPVPKSELELTPEDVTAALDGIAQRWEAARRPTYAAAAVKEIAVPRGKRARTAGEHGTEWGTVIHLLLQTALTNPGADLEQLARVVLAEQGLQRDRAAEAAAVARGVARSPLWARAQAAARRLVEVPFQLSRPPAASAETVPQVLHGVIDLAFFEGAGWVIVDYKTDAVTEGELSGLTAHYRPQVIAYAEAWQQLLSEPVKERGLYFTALERYVVVQGNA